VLAQKGLNNKVVLSLIAKLFGVGKVNEHSNRGNYEYRVESAANVEVLFKYFDENELKTKKSLSYKIWREVHLGITQQLQDLA
jgi:hypothetical protein